jgi:DNA polymerase alpha subunit B
LLAVLTYCINYKMSPADLVSNWEVYYLNRSAHTRLERDE